MPTPSEIKQKFEAGTPPFVYVARLQTFYASNEILSLPEMLARIPQAQESKQDTSEYSILVGESDFLSAITKITVNNILVCDIDHRLIIFLEKQVEFFRAIYSKYQAKQLTFEQVVEVYFLEFLSQFKGQHKGEYDQIYIDDPAVLIRERINDLGCLHFLFNETNFVNAMERLKEVDIAFIQTNLYCPFNQENFTEALKAETVKEFYFTNVLCYEDSGAGECISFLLEPLKFSKNPLFLRTLHDTGPSSGIWMRGKINPCNDYGFYDDSLSKFEEARESIPTFLAELDIHTLNERKLLTSDLKSEKIVRFMDSRAKAKAIQHEMHFQKMRSKSFTLEETCHKFSAWTHDKAWYFGLHDTLAKTGDSAAQYVVSKCYRHGYGVTKNSVESLEWLTKAAENHHTIAQYHLAMLLLESPDATKQQKGVEWLKLAAAKNHAFALYKLAECYRDGKNIAVDISEAHKLFIRAYFAFQKAAKMGYEEAEKFLSIDRVMCEAIEGYDLIKELELEKEIESAPEEKSEAPKPLKSWCVLFPDILSKPNKETPEFATLTKKIIALEKEVHANIIKRP